MPFWQILWLAGMAGFLGTLLLSQWKARHAPWFEDLSPILPRRWPSLSVVFAARDEARKIGAATRSLLRSAYPNLHCVAVDDRSGDATGAILDAVATEDPRLQVLHVEELAAGWLGKPHALAWGVAQSQSDWVLLTDADVHFEADSLRRLVAWAESRELDHFTVYPETRGGSFLLHSVYWVVLSTLFLHLRIGRDGVQSGKVFMGVGACNLVRREVLERGGGMAWLAMELGDDLGVGMLVRQAGGRSGIAMSRGLVNMEWYRSVPELVRGLEKNMFAVVGRFQRLRTLGLVSLCWLTGAAPLLGLLLPGLRGVTILTFLVYLAVAVPVARKANFPALPTLLAPFGFFVLGYAILRSMVQTLRNGGVIWRETHYPIALLRAGQRVSF